MKYLIALGLIATQFTYCSRISRVEYGLPRSYSGKSYSLLEKGKLWFTGVKKLSVGRSLVLNADSTFEYQLCGKIQQGRFITKNDTVVLNCNDRCYYFLQRKNTLQRLDYQKEEIFERLVLERK